MDVEAVGEHERLAGGEVGGNALLVEGSLLLVVDEDHDDVGSLGSLGARHDLETLSLGLCPALGALVQADDHVDAGILQVQCMGMALGAVADDGDGLAGQLLQIAVLLIKNPVLSHAH